MSLAFTSPQRPSLRAILLPMVLFTLVFIASCKKDDDTTYSPPGNNPPTPITFLGGIDQEGDTFTSVFIGSQEWMSENLNVASYSDGTPIPQITDQNEWDALTTGAWCWYDNDSAWHATTFGRLYNWYAVAGIYDAASEANPALRKQLAPTGWHVPADVEWSTMINFLDPAADGGENPNIAGGMMKTTGTLNAGTGLWGDPNEMASNVSGFSGVPGGGRFLGGYTNIISNGYWWSSSEFNPYFALCRYLDNSDGSAFRNITDKKHGFSVRCLRN